MYTFKAENHLPYDGWYENVFEDAKTIGALMGFVIRDIGFSGFWSQGDGAHFTGFFGYAKGAVKAVKDYAPEDTTLHDIAERWADVQKPYFYGLRGEITHRGRYQHENCTLFDFWHEQGTELPESFWESHGEDVKEVARDFMRWIYKQLQLEYEFQLAAELAQAYKDKKAELAEKTSEARELVAAMRKARKDGQQPSGAICAALRNQLADYREGIAQLRQYRDDIADAFHYWPNGQPVTLDQFLADYT